MIFIISRALNIAGVSVQADREKSKFFNLAVVETGLESNKGYFITNTKTSTWNALQAESVKVGDDLGMRVV